MLVVTGIFAVYFYTRATGRLAVSEDGLRFTRAVDEVLVPFTDISSVRLAFYSSWQTGTFRVKRKSRRLPEFFYYVSPATNFGGRSSTKRRSAARSKARAADP